MKNSVSFLSDLSKFGIGLFETIKVSNAPIDIELHLNRLYNSIKELELDFKYEEENIKYNILEYIKKNNVKDKALRLTLFDEGYNISIREIIYSSRMYKEGFKLNISPIKRGNSIIYKHKTTNYFENIYTREYALKNGYNDGLFVDLNNNILECSMSNIFFIKNNIIYTPTHKLPILDGITKRRVIDICGELNIKINEIYINLDDIAKFDFAFVTNSIMGIMKVNEIQNIKYNKSNEIFESVLSLYKSYI